MLHSFISNLFNFVMWYINYDIMAYRLLLNSWSVVMSALLPCLICCLVWFVVISYLLSCLIRCSVWRVVIFSVVMSYLLYCLICYIVSTVLLCHMFYYVICFLVRASAWLNTWSCPSVRLSACLPVPVSLLSKRPSSYCLIHFGGNSGAALG